MKLNKQIVLAIAGALVVVVLYFSFSNKPPKVSAYDDLRIKLLDSLAIQNEVNIVNLQKKASKAKKSEKPALLDELAHQWEHAGYLAISGDYLRQLADIDPTYERYMVAGETLFKALATDTAQTMQVNLVYGARYCYEKAMEIKSGDVNAQIGLATVLVQGTNEPMKGILMLREIVDKDPGNINANMELGKFSMMSGQFDKAIERFAAVLQKDSLHLQSRYFLAEGYLGLKDTTSAISTLEEIIKIEQDTMVQSRIRLYIDYLKKL